MTTRSSPASPPANGSRRPVRSSSTRKPASTLRRRTRCPPTTACRDRARPLPPALAYQTVRITTLYQPTISSRHLGSPFYGVKLLGPCRYYVRLGAPLTVEYVRSRRSRTREQTLKTKRSLRSVCPPSLPDEAERSAC